jgi:hypothetical protein
VLIARPISLAVLALAFAGLEIARAAITFTIPLATLDDIRRLDHQTKIAEVIRAARADSDARIFLAAYVTADDARAHRAAAARLADQLVIEIGVYLAGRGIEADRISGKGMGIDPAIGRAVVVSFGVHAPPVRMASAP